MVVLELLLEKIRKLEQQEVGLPERLKLQPVIFIFFRDFYFLLDCTVLQVQNRNRSLPILGFPFDEDDLMVAEHVEVVVLRIDDYLLQGLALMAQMPNHFSLFPPAALEDHKGAVAGRAYVQQYLTSVQFNRSHYYPN